MENRILLYVCLLFCIGSIIFCALTFAHKSSISNADKNAIDSFNELYLKNIYVDPDSDSMIFKLPTLGLKIGPTASSTLFTDDDTPPTQFLFELQGINPESSGEPYPVMKITSPESSDIYWSFSSDGNIHTST